MVPVNLSKWIYFFGLAVIAIGMPVSVFLMSLGQFIVIAGFLLDGKLIEKLKRFWKNKSAVVLSSVLLMHLLGLVYTSDFDYAFNDIRVKAPLLLLPLLIAGSEPLSKKLFNWLMFFFVGSVTIGTLISMGVYDGIIPTRHPVVDIRDISIFISHIRFSMMISLSVFICAYYIYFESSALKRTAMIVLTVWLLVFLVILNALTGIVGFLTVTLVLVVAGLFSLKDKVLRVSSLITLLILLLGLGLYFRALVDEQVYGKPTNFSKYAGKTALGNEYRNDTVSRASENGFPVWMYICDQELEQAWNKRSGIHYDGKNKKGDLVRYTLIRYLTSKGLRKDDTAVRSLSNEEINRIECGITNVNYIGKSGLSVRIMQTVWEFRTYAMGYSPNGHSSVMRIEFWKAALGIIKKHPVIGVGTGDVKIAFEQQYEEMHSSLDSEHRLRSHNQFLSIAVAFGSVGLLWFFISLFYPMIKEKRIFDYFYVSFFIIFFVSMLVEDTLETQAGVTFYAFFNTIFLFAKPPSELPPGQV
jgi:hypothetical protein